MVRLFAPDADVVNLAGQWFKGRAAFAKSLEGLHSAKTKESVWHTEQIQTSFLTPEIAIVHVYFSSSGERNPDGSADAAAARHFHQGRSETRWALGDRGVAGDEDRAAGNRRCIIEKAPASEPVGAVAQLRP